MVLAAPVGPCSSYTTIYHPGFRKEGEKLYEFFTLSNNSDQNDVYKYCRDSHPMKKENFPRPSQLRG